MAEQPDPKPPTTQHPMPGTPQVAVDDPRAEVEALVTEFARAKRQVEKAHEKLELADAALRDLFDRAETDRIRLVRGWLVHKRGEQPEFVIEL